MSCRSEGKAKQEGRLPGYAPDLTRYCTTCRTEIRNQVVKKSKCCPNFHPVDLRNEWSEDWGRCTMCDNYINARHVYCGTCGNENENRDPQKKSRIERTRELEKMWGVVRKLNRLGEQLGVRIKVENTDTLKLEKIHRGSQSLLMLPFSSPSEESGSSQSPRSTEATCGQSFRDCSQSSSSSLASEGVQPKRDTNNFPKSAKGVKIRSSSRLASQVTVAGPVGSSSQITNGNVSIEEIRGEPEDVHMEDVEFLNINIENVNTQPLGDETKLPVGPDIKREVMSEGEEDDRARMGFVVGESGHEELELHVKKEVAVTPTPSTSSGSGNVRRSGRKRPKVAYNEDVPDNVVMVEEGPDSDDDVIRVLTQEMIDDMARASNLK